ncbi:MAG: ribosome biogenesis GTPase YlqF [Bacilli bacterium]|nr:ribosome biogenesis GTPase YlqF [Bacilli bacterium]
MNNQDNEKVFQKSNINWYPGHMARTKREIKEKIDLIDVILEVVDARIPYSSKNKDIDVLVGNKPRIIVMTKVDLCDMDESLKWKLYYENNNYKVIMVDLINDKNVNEIIDVCNILGKDINNKRIEKGMKARRLRVLVVGIPNVGKSTLINRLVGKKVTNVGNKPGVTKNLEWIRVNENLELLDTPGILWPKLDGKNIALNLASMTAIKEEVLNIDEVAIYIVNTLFKYYSTNICSRYNITYDEDIVSVLDGIGKRIGAIRNNETDYDRVYNTILKDLRDGYLGKVTFDRYEDR